MPEEAARLLTDGRAALAVLAVVVLEGGLLFLRWRGGLGAAPGRWAPQIVAGMGLVLALYCHQSGRPPYLLASCLVFAGIAHLWGFPSRWRA